MTEIIINEDALELVIQKLQSFVWTDQNKQEIELMRQDFAQTYDKAKLNSLLKEDYFAGLGRKQGCLAYDLEWGTKKLGSIKGGSKYKYGYESDFSKIKSLLQKVISVNTSNAYKLDGKLSNDLETIVSLSKEINGFKTGRTVIPKLLSIYFPHIFLPIFNDQDRFLNFLVVSGFDTENTGLALYFEYNFKLLKIKSSVEEITNRTLGNFEFAKLLYFTFPKEQDEEIEGQPAILPIVIEEQKFEALEVQHYQTLLHRNMQRLFPKLKYFDEEQQLQKNGQYDTQVVGIMDMLTIDEKGDFVIIEIKRKAKDLSIGQILRYMGWTKEELCKNGQSVRGLIVAESKDVNLEFALRVVPDVKFYKLGLSITLVEQ
jgi:Endonuclease NucS